MSASSGAPIPLEGWQGSTGISGSFQSESVATFAWNRWQGSTGISGNFRAEYAGNRRNVMEPLLGEVFDLLALDHASVTHEGDLLDAKPALELRNLGSQGVRILGIARKHFDG